MGSPQFLPCALQAGLNLRCVVTSVLQIHGVMEMQPDVLLDTVVKAKEDRSCCCLINSTVN